MHFSILVVFFKNPLKQTKGYRADFNKTSGLPHPYMFAGLPEHMGAIFWIRYQNFNRRLRTRDLHPNKIKERKWLYQSPLDILIKASNGASDYGNKFGQPLICGSVLTFEHEENKLSHGYDKVIMLAGGIGFGNKKNSIKKK